MIYLILFKHINKEILINNKNAELIVSEKIKI